MTVTAYNFAKPAQLSGEGNQRLLGWFRTAFALAGKAWAKEFPYALQAGERDLDTRRCGDVLARLGDGTVGFRIVIAGNRLPTLLLLPRPLLLALVGGLLGESAEQLPADRELTAVEQSLAEYFLQTLWLPFFKDAWPGAVQAIWEWPQPEPNLACSRLIAADEPVVVFSWSLTGPFGAAPCTWLFHRKGLAELIGHGEAEAAPAEPAGTRVEALVRNLPIDLVVVLGSADVCLSQLAHLQVGDVILLNQRVGEPLTARVNDEPKFRGWAGRSGSGTAFRIDSVIEG